MALSNLTNQEKYIHLTLFYNGFLNKEEEHLNWQIFNKYNLKS